MCSLLIQGDRCDCWFSPADGDKALRMAQEMAVSIPCQSAHAIHGVQNCCHTLAVVCKIL